jgi:hypothetical protein
MVSAAVDDPGVRVNTSILTVAPEPDRGCCHVDVFALSVLPILAWGAYSFVQKRLQARGPDFERVAAAIDPVTLVRISIAFDAGARSQLQRALDLAMPAGALPHQVVGTVAELLVREIAHARMFAVGVSKVFGREYARALFDAEVRQQRGRTSPDALAARAGAGAPRAPFRTDGGYVVATLCVGRAAALHLRSGQGATLSDLCVLLNVLCSARRDETLWAASVWAPSDPEEMLSVAEMVRVFPELVPVADGNVSSGGFCVARCPFCNNTYPAESAECPRCHRPSLALLPPGHTPTGALPI